MITPFDQQGAVNYALAEQLADHLINNGTDTVVVGGTTGESPTLLWEEVVELCGVVQRSVGNRGKVVLGTGGNSTQVAISKTQKALQLGVAGSLQVVPYYNKPPQEGLYFHFRAIAEACPELPIILYNVPGRTGQNLHAETVARLSELPNIHAIKEASGNLEQIAQIRTLTSPDFTLYSGDDVLTLPLLSLGARGVVSVASHLVGTDIQRMIQAFEAGQIQVARDIHLKFLPLFQALFCTTNPIPLKAALQLKGWEVGRPRLPLVDLPEDLYPFLKGVLQNIQLL